MPARREVADRRTHAVAGGPFRGRSFDRAVAHLGSTRVQSSRDRSSRWSQTRIISIRSCVTRYMNEKGVRGIENSRIPAIPSTGCPIDGLSPIASQALRYCAAARLAPSTKIRAYQHRLLFSYLANAARRLDRRDPAAADLACWVADNALVLDDEKPGEVVRRRRGRRERMVDPGDPHLTEDGWAAFRQTLAGKTRRVGRRRAAVAGRVSNPAEGQRLPQRTVESRTGAPALGSGGCSGAFAPGLSPASTAAFPVPAHRTRRADSGTGLCGIMRLAHGPPAQRRAQGR